MNNPQNKWLFYYQPNRQAAVRLFCFPYSGAGASLFLPWRSILPKSIDLVPVQLPGRENRIGERPYTQLAPLVAAVAEAIRPFLDKPFAFFGHSMGTLLSFELSRHLRRTANMTPHHLFMSGHSAPQATHYDNPMHQLPDPEFITRLYELNGTPAGVLEHDELRDIFLPVIRADFTICETYRYQPDQPLDCPITALAGLADPYLSRSDLDAWQEQTTGSFILRMFPGDHFYLNSQQSHLMRILAKELDELCNKSRSYSFNKQSQFTEPFQANDKFIPE